MFDKYMNDDPDEDDFLPPDMERVEYILGLTVDLYSIQATVPLTLEQQRALMLASTHMKVLMAQAISGWTLYSEESKYGDRLSILATELYNYIVINQPEKIDSFQDIGVLQEHLSFRNDGPTKAIITDFFNPDAEEIQHDEDM